MPFSKDRFIEIRPYLYHSTSSSNLANIKRSRRLLSAAALIKQAGRQTIAVRRIEPEPLQTGSEIWLQTQRPLHEGNIALANNFTFEDLVSLLNKKIFFWPGTSAGPIDYGCRHLKGNKWPGPPATIRVCTKAMIDTVKSAAEFCAYNSGSPRCVDGIKSPRGPNTFAVAKAFERNAGKVVEVVFDQEIDLPETTELWDEATSRWISLFDQATS